MPHIKDLSDTTSPSWPPPSEYLHTPPILMHRSSTTDSSGTKVNLSGPVIAGIIAGTLAFGVIISISWCLIKQRQARYKQKLIFAPYVDSRFSTPPQSAMASPVAQEYYPPYPQIIGHPYSQRLPAPTRVSQSTVVTMPSESSAMLPRSPPSQPQVPQETEFAPTTVHPSARNTWPMSGAESGASLMRQNSADTASIYSCTSAPHDAHEHSFRSFSVESAGSPSETGSNEPSTTDSSYMSPMRRIQLSDPSMQQIREELAPETYARAPRRIESISNTSSRSHYRLASTSISEPPVPPLPEQVHVPAIAPLPTAFLSGLPFSPYRQSPPVVRPDLHKPANRKSFPSSISIKTFSSNHAMAQRDQESPAYSSTDSSQHFPLTPTSWFGEVPPRFSLPVASEP